MLEASNLLKWSFIRRFSLLLAKFRRKLKDFLKDCISLLALPNVAFSSNSMLSCCLICNMSCFTWEWDSLSNEAYSLSYFVSTLFQEGDKFSSLESVFRMSPSSTFIDSSFESLLLFAQVLVEVAPFFRRVRYFCFQYSASEFSSLTIALFMIILARWANFTVERVSRIALMWGLRVHIIRVFEFPPNESFSKWVSLL